MLLYKRKKLLQPLKLPNIYEFGKKKKTWEFDQGLLQRGSMAEEPSSAQAFDMFFDMFLILRTSPAATHEHRKGCKGINDLGLATVTRQRRGHLPPRAWISLSWKMYIKISNAKL